MNVMEIQRSAHAFTDTEGVPHSYTFCRRSSGLIVVNERRRSHGANSFVCNASFIVEPDSEPDGAPPMRLPRIRMTTRRWMIAVAVVMEAMPFIGMIALLIMLRVAVETTVSRSSRALDP